ncbi:hypothetical protein ACIQC0_09885 [Pseudarthrobacter sp. NPDC092419]|uniref:hypothetical protein n=1 Tax=Pseudarthrobacter sp. NPDC092419 TaxID=3364414 RepID=UPI00381AC53B
MAIAANAVLIQTIASEESVLKNGIRVGVLVLVGLSLAVSGVRMPVGVMLLILYSTLMMLLRQNPDQLSYIFIFVLVFLMFAVKERDLEKALLLSSLFSLGLVFVFLGLGITQNTVTEYRSRMTFGTNGVPFFFNLVYGAFTMLVFYFHKYRFRSRHWVALGAVAATTYLFQLTDARGGYLAFGLFVAALYLMPALSRSLFFRGAVMATPVICIGLAFYVATLWGDGQANRLLSNRPILYERFLAELTEADVVLSTSVKQFDRAVTIVDNSYLHLLMGGGVVMFIVVLVLFARAVYNLFKAGRLPEIAFLVATCAYFNSESIMLRIENMFVIYFWYLVLRFCGSLRKEDAVSISPTPVPERKAKVARVPTWERDLEARLAAAKNPGQISIKTRPGRY